MTRPVRVEWRVGCCGFAKGREAYFSKFNLVEVQQTFYKLPKKELAPLWREKAPPSFEFILKAPQLITHTPASPTYRRLGDVIPPSRVSHYGFFRPSSEVRNARQRIEKMADQLRSSILLYQCPASFKPEQENFGHLKRYFRRKSKFDRALELRGPDWDSSLIQDVCDELGVIPVVDPMIQKPLYGQDIGYFRMHGLPAYHYRYTYTSKDLAQLYDRLSSLPIKTCYVLFNNFNMFQDAVAFKKLI